MLGIWLLIAVIAILSSIFIARLSTKAKANMKCLAFNSQDVHLQVRSLLTKSNIFFSDLAWAPSQEAYHHLGQAQNTPKEIWINAIDLDRVKTLLERNYSISQIPTAWIIDSKNKSLQGP